MTHADRVKEAGRLQIMSLAVFCMASLVAVAAFLGGDYWVAAFAAAVMVATFALYQINSRIITTPPETYP